MNNYQQLADLLFPHVNRTPAELEQQYPPRTLSPEQKITRFAPSPTGFVHFGGMYQALINERLAHGSGGIVYLRIEDTDAKREVANAASQLITTLAHYGVQFDEGATVDAEGNVVDNGDYGPYRQSQRAEIYHVYAKELVLHGHAYPVFYDETAQAAALAADKKTENQTRDWAAEADLRRQQTQRERAITLEQVQEALLRHEHFVLRLRAEGDPEKKILFTDLIKGKLELPENDEDFILLKSDGIPTYHFAHVVDDHLMGTTHVVRGEEWLSSLPKHLMLFQYLGLRPVKYLHTAQVMRLDEQGNKKKLSKRDMGANMADFDAWGYAPACVTEYLMTLINSNYEEWRTAHPTDSYTAFPFSIKKMSPSGCLFDKNKLDDVSKNVLSRQSSETVYEGLYTWATRFAPDFAKRLENRDYALQILSIGRGGKKPRKDYATYAEAMAYMSLFYDETFERIDPITPAFPAQQVKQALTLFLQNYNAADAQDTWFEKIKEVARTLGFADDMKAFKQQPEAYPGNVSDISMFLRIAVTGKLASPDMYTVMQILGETRVRDRIHSFLQTL